MLIIYFYNTLRECCLQSESTRTFLKNFMGVSYKEKIPLEYHINLET